VVSNPEISIIIAARNEAELLPLCLASILDQAAPFAFEVIVVDNGSDDHTLTIAQQIAIDNPIIKVFHEPRRGTPKARNLGAQKAASDILVFTDSDCTYPPNWLAELTMPLRIPETTFPIGVVGGAVTSAFRRPDWPNLIEHFADQLFKDWEQGDRTARFPGFLPWAPTCNLAIRKDLFFDLGGFEELWTIGYDPDLCWRASLSGFTVLYRDSAEVFHLRRGTLWDLLRQAYNYAYYNAALFRTYRRLWGFSRFQTAISRCLTWPARFMKAIAQPRKFWALSFLVAMAQLIGRAGQFFFPLRASPQLTESRLGNAKVRATLPIPFATLHRQGYCHWPHEDDLILFQPRSKKHLGLNPPARIIWEAKLQGKTPDLSHDELSAAHELEAALIKEGLLQ
jgi:glycosyltransferase involved in cell wall biosynthesis